MCVVFEAHSYSFVIISNMSNTFGLVSFTSSEWQKSNKTKPNRNETYRGERTLCVGIECIAYRQNDILQCIHIDIHEKVFDFRSIRRDINAKCWAMQSIEAASLSRCELWRAPLTWLTVNQMNGSALIDSQCRKVVEIRFCRGCDCETMCDAPRPRHLFIFKTFDSNSKLLLTINYFRTVAKFLPLR